MRNIIILIFLLIASCSSNRDDYFKHETKYLNQKIEYFSYKIESEYNTNPQKITPYYKLIREISDSLSDIREDIKNHRFNVTIYRFEQLGKYIQTLKLLDDDYITKIIIPARIEKWASIKNSKVDSEKSNVLIYLDLLKLESDIIEFLYNSIEKDYYNFNKLIPVVTGSSNSVKRGDTYQAKIYLAGIDTFTDPFIIITDLNEPDSILLNGKVDNKRTFNLLIEDGIGIYNIETSTPGKKGFKGLIQIPNSEGYLEKIPFRHEYIVE